MSFLIVLAWAVTKDNLS